MRNCPVCDRNNSNQPIEPESRDGWMLKRCGDCSHVYLENPVSYEALQDEFRWAETAIREQERRRTAFPIVSAVTSAWKGFVKRVFLRNKCLTWTEHYVAPGPVLDVGCGPGGLLASLSEQHTPYGIEIDAGVAKLARAKVAPRQGQILVADGPSGLSQMPDAFFSGIVMKSYLEHETSPLKVLLEARRVLKPDGRLIIKVPNYATLNRRLRGSKWPGYHFPDHVSYFDPTTLARLVSRAGFLVERNKWIDHFPLNDNLYLMAQPRAGAAISSASPATLWKAA
ncbi:MAG: class I SAM-dependent methyltransferase [Planctomycetota bacterium]